MAILANLDGQLRQTALPVLCSLLLATLGDTVSNNTHHRETTAFNGTITVGDTVILHEAGSYSLSAQQQGTYGGGSFSFGSMAYTADTTRQSSQQHYSGYTATSFLTANRFNSEEHDGVTTYDSYGGGSRASFTRQDTITSFTTQTNQDASTYHLYEQGGYSNETWGLASFNLVQQDRSANTYQLASTDASLSSGGYAESYACSGQLGYEVSGTFTGGNSISTTTQNGGAVCYSLYEAGTYAGATFSLSSFAFIYGQSSLQTVSASGGSDQTFSGADDIGLGSSNPTFTGTDIGTLSYSEQEESTSNLSEQGTYAGGSFHLSTVDYSGESDHTYSMDDTDVSSWSGGFAGNETSATSDSGSGALTMTATGSFASGSWSLSNYTLQGWDAQPAPTTTAASKAWTPLVAAAPAPTAAARTAAAALPAATRAPGAAASIKPASRRPAPTPTPATATTTRPCPR